MPFLRTWHYRGPDRSEILATVAGETRMKTISVLIVTLTLIAACGQPAEGPGSTESPAPAARAPSPPPLPEVAPDVYAAAVSNPGRHAGDSERDASYNFV